MRTLKKKGSIFVDLLKVSAGIKEIRQIGLMIAIELENETKCAEIVKELAEKRIVVDRFLFVRRLLG